MVRQWCHLSPANIRSPGRVPQSVLNAVVEPHLEKKHNANALTAMREHSAQESDLCIVWGGRIQGASGWMAGILEEVACQLKHKKPLLVLGGFGGCARLIADFLHDPKVEWPEQLSLSASADSGRDALLTDDERQKLADRISEAEVLMKEFRSALLSEVTVNGLSSQLIRDSMLDENTRSVVRCSRNKADGIVCAGS